MSIRQPHDEKNRFSDRELETIRDLAREAEDAHCLEALRAAVQVGAADIAAGRFKSFDTKELLRDHLMSEQRWLAEGCSPTPRS